MKKSDLIIPKLNRLPGEHFSLSDWVVTPGVGWMLTDEHYHSAPTSLTLWDPSAGQNRRVYLGEALGKCIPAGRLTTWHFYHDDLWKTFMFNWRSQEYSDLEYAPNTYWCRFFQDTYNIRKKVGVDTTLFASGNLPHAREERVWERFRITWWLVLNEEFSWTLRMLLEQEHLGEWVEVASCADPNPSFSDSEINYVGMFLKSYGLYYYISMFDDTIVERKT